MQSEPRPDMFTLEISSINRLGEAQRRIGGLESLARIWPFWDGFARGPLTALFGLTEAQMGGYEVDLAELLALGPEPNPTRPNLGMRQAVGVVLALRRLEQPLQGSGIPAGLASEIFRGIDAPHLSRGMNLGLETASPAGAGLPGAAYWAMAPKWTDSGLPALWSAGLSLASWEREGPEHPNRATAGRVLVSGLAQRLGLTCHAFCFLGPGLELAASKQPNGLDGIVQGLRRNGSWRLFVEVFLAAAMMSAAQVADHRDGVRRPGGGHCRPKICIRSMTN